MRNLTLLTSLTCALALAFVLAFVLALAFAPRTFAAEPAASVERLRQLNLPCWSEEALAGFELLTRAEQVALLDEMYYRAVNCPVERDSNSDISGGGGGGGNSNSDNGGGDGGGGNGGNSGNSDSNSDTVNSDIGNSDIATGGVGVAVGDGIRGEQPADKRGGVLAGETAEGADEVAVRTATGGTLGVHTPNDRTTPSDIPSADNDDIIARQLRQAALDETDAEIKAKLWDEYRRYVGLAVQGEGGSDGESASEQ